MLYIQYLICIAEYLSFGLDLTNLCSACSRPSNNLMTFSGKDIV